jgi:hypothetical protein
MLVHCFLLDENMAWQTSPTDLSDPKHRLASSLEKSFMVNGIIVSLYSLGDLQKNTKFGMSKLSKGIHDIDIE